MDGGRVTIRPCTLDPPNAYGKTWNVCDDDLYSYRDECCPYLDPELFHDFLPGSGGRSYDRDIANLAEKQVTTSHVWGWGN